MSYSYYAMDETPDGTKYVKFVNRDSRDEWIKRKKTRRKVHPGEYNKIFWAKQKSPFR